ncbi:cysteine synthase family protein [Micromonospora olivasterospora]|uniref:Cystathionine beta-synthase/cysteine synthase A n=1 Tax=Micromonospora olivasterospora TaxID=1880 RepID=A0A562I269_MICOL|nr:cysteine synthase family protein [Micromonospora olivasterospora]TWH65129.1 cystathionine beta-synthase/cysteine synthase A [Micromonospora olivasterospora]
MDTPALTGGRAHPGPTWQRLGRLSRDQLERLVGRVGATPVAAVTVTVDGRRCEVLLKLEGHNPGGSVKDRTALSLVRGLETAGTLHPGDTLVESTSGNLGVALAFIARARGYRFHAVVDPHVTAENLSTLRELGALVDVVDSADENGNYLRARLRRVRELCAADPRYVWTDQYGSAHNPLAHYATTAPELDAQAGGRLQAVVVAVSTGGTLAGIGRYFRERRPGVRIVAVDVAGSVALAGRPAPRLLTGIGSSQRSRFATDDLYDETVFVSELTAVATVATVRERTGIRIGGSGGAALAAAAVVARDHGLSRVACVCPDDGRKYEGSLFNDRWLREHGLADWSGTLPFTDLTRSPSVPAVVR